MCTLPVLVVAPGYLIPVRLLTFVTQSRSYGISGDWQGRGDDARREWFQGRCDRRQHATSTFTYGISFKPQ